MPLNRNVINCPLTMICEWNYDVIFVSNIATAHTHTHTSRRSANERMQAKTATITINKSQTNLLCVTITISHFLLYLIELKALLLIRHFSTPINSTTACIITLLHVLMSSFQLGTGMFPIDNDPMFILWKEIVFKGNRCRLSRQLVDRLLHVEFLHFYMAKMGNMERITVIIVFFPVYNVSI